MVGIMSRRLTIILIPLLVISGGLAFSPEMRAQARRNTNHGSVWDGVYTDAQAQEGQALFEANCIKCHGRDTGGFAAKELYGDRFFERWREDTLDSLYGFMQNMPPAGPALSAPEYMNILSHILWANGFPPSDWTLTMATDPVRARNTEEATEIELKAADAKQLSTQTFELGNFFMLGSFDRDAHEGHRMLAKGALVRQDERDRISLTALDSVASSCP